MKSLIEQQVDELLQERNYHKICLKAVERRLIELSKEHDLRIALE